MSERGGNGIAPLLEKLLVRVLPSTYAEALLGDLAEEYMIQCATAGRAAALRRYRKEAAAAILNAVVTNIIKVIQGRDEMRRVSRALAFSVRNIGAFLLFWVIAFALVQTASRLLGGWPATEFARLAACLAGVIIATRMKARLTAYLLAGMVAFTLAELAVRLWSGTHRVVQGLEAQSAVMGAAVLGTVFGVVMTRYFQRGVAA
ncbi:uncharacterized protein SOCE26_013120 [Sorangium cellulosum]|uniref:Uncharacterized protein n=1 Tax=Sorangium cellulosum TaxID=56 RepID=A0A2L0EKT8_SORCE|nr:hypothetical protein [Sorangium cellulosum]AUX39917.1 uncharacterized protein SOCE26_013120 [Sorangium cellulosum]